MKALYLSIVGFTSMLIPHWGPFALIVMAFFIGLFLIQWKKEIDENTILIFDLDKYLKVEKLTWRDFIPSEIWDAEGREREDYYLEKDIKLDEKWCMKVRRIW